MDRLVSMSEARANLAALLDEANDHEVFLLRHGRPVGVLLSVTAYEAALDRIEDLEDTVATLQARAEDDFAPFERTTPALASTR